MIVYTFEQRIAKWTCDQFTEDADFNKKESSFQMKLILILAGMETSKIVSIGTQTLRTHMLCIRLNIRWEILRYYFENHGNVAECVRRLRTDFRRREAQPTPYVRYLVKKVTETGILIDEPKPEKPKNSAYTREYCCCGRKCV